MAEILPHSEMRRFHETLVRRALTIKLHTEHGYEAEVDNGYTPQGIIDVACLTTLPSGSDLWSSIRRFRFTGHHLHAILHSKNLDMLAYRMATVVPYANTSWHFQYDYRRQAVSSYIQNVCKRGERCLRVGTLIHPYFQLLVGTPYGIVAERTSSGEFTPLRVLNVKRTFGYIQSGGGLGMSEAPFLTDCETWGLDNKDMALKKTSVEYMRCQLLMAITGLQRCDMYLYTTHEGKSAGHCIAVKFDFEFFRKTLDACIPFYKSYKHLRDILIGENACCVRCRIMCEKNFYLFKCGATACLRCFESLAEYCICGIVNDPKRLLPSPCQQGWHFASGRKGKEQTWQRYPDDLQRRFEDSAGEGRCTFQVNGRDYVANFLEGYQYPVDNGAKRRSIQQGVPFRLLSS